MASDLAEGEIFSLFDRGYENPIKCVLRGDNVVMMTAIANPKYMIESIKEKYNLVSQFHFKDHHNFSQADIDKVLKKAIENNAYIIMTEKDAAKIMSLKIASSEKFRFCVAPISVEFVDTENTGNRQKIINYINKLIKSKDGKYSLHNKQFNI